MSEKRRINSIVGKERKGQSKRTAHFRIDFRLIRPQRHRCQHFYEKGESNVRAGVVGRNTAASKYIATHTHTHREWNGKLVSLCRCTTWMLFDLCLVLRRWRTDTHSWPRDFGIGHSINSASKVNTIIECVSLCQALPKSAGAGVDVDVTWSGQECIGLV